MRSIYLDHAAATPMRPEVREAVAPFAEGVVGNPSSVHRWGREARRVLEGARERTAALLGVHADEVHFVRGGTESVNLALQGWAVGAGVDGAPKILRSSVEHSAVRACVDALEVRGIRTDTIPVTPDGSVRLPRLDRPDPDRSDATLVSCQWVNPETGMILPIPDVAAACEEAGADLHVDAVQAGGRIPLPLDTVPAGLVSLSGHKLGGPRGSGVLVIRRDVELAPVLFGGGQEGGLRPGTEDLGAAVGFARALEVALEQLESESRRLRDLRDELEDALVRVLPELRIHGESAPRAPHVLNVGVPGVAPDVLLGALDLEGVGVSAGSACRSGSTEVSPVLDALYGAEAREVAPIRFSLGWCTTREEVREAAEVLPEVVERVAILGVGR